MLAGDQPSLAVAGVAVGEIRGLAEHADRARFLFPFENALVGDVAAQEIAAVAEPHRSLGPAPPPCSPVPPPTVSASIFRSADRARGSPDRGNRSPAASRRGGILLP